MPARDARSAQPGDESRQALWRLVEALNAALTLDLEPAPLLVRRGRIHQLLHQPDRAEADYSAAISFS